MSRQPSVTTDDYGTTTVDHSHGAVYAVLTKDEDETFWRFEVALDPPYNTTKAEQIAAARTVIAAATDLVNRNTNGATK